MSLAKKSYGEKLEVIKTKKSDLNDVLCIEKEAFGADEGPVIVNLVNGLLNDPTAMPILSLMAINNAKAVGHILFTKALITNSSFPVKAVILAPLAVIPEAQKKGVGGELIKEGLNHLKERGVQLVFVLGHPEYYPRFGFKTAGLLGFEAPYPIPEKNANAWMVQELQSGIIGKVTGKVQCSDVLNHPEYWRE
jgi:putative acetyltransferase